MPPRFRSRNDQQKHHISKLGSKSKGNYSISDTQKLLKNEKGVNKRKVDVSVHKVLFSEFFIRLMKAVLQKDYFCDFLRVLLFNRWQIHPGRILFVQVEKKMHNSNKLLFIS